MNLGKGSKKVLVIGNGGREHCLIWKIKQSPLLEEIYTDNVNFKNFAKYLEIESENFLELSCMCKNEEIDIVIVGQEKYLAAGLVDILTSEGINVFGPSKNAAKLEFSKSFTKELCSMYNIPSAEYCYCTNIDSAKEYIKNSSMPIVLKANGLAAGKGVFICKTEEKAIQIAEKMLNGMFGAASSSIIIEQFLKGQELSYFALLDGKTILPFSFARDRKQVQVNGDILNTGGMGSYSPVRIDSKIEKSIIRDIVYPTVNALSEINVEYKGILFAGIMLTNSGPKLLEYNVRLGDPEAQSILPRLETDFLELIVKTINGNLRGTEIQFSKKSSACLVIASKGYPNAYNTGFAIHNIERAKKEVPGLEVFYAGVKCTEQNEIFSAGGRVLNLVSISDSLAECRKNIYKAAKIINWNEGFYLEDIAKEEI